MNKEGRRKWKSEREIYAMEINKGGWKGMIRLLRSPTDCLRIKKLR
jgi:hypothetical protein